MMSRPTNVSEALPAARSSQKADAACGTTSFFPVAAGSEWKAAFLEAQVDATPDGILVVDSHGKILLRNKRFNALFKVPPEIAGDGGDTKLLERVIAKTKDPAQFLERIRYLYAHPGETGQDEIELIDGTVLDRYSAPVLGRAGEYYGRIWTFRDITERKQLEAQFLRAQRLESVGALASGVAHDLNNILAPVLMAAPLLRDGAPDSDFRALAEMVEKCARRGADIIKQLLT
ncbi:MAG: histidine kinase dimerization/phospho-acceptor domain-containing protein, partial [Limisphaerales bacterium]